VYPPVVTDEDPLIAESCADNDAIIACSSATVAALAVTGVTTNESAIATPTKPATYFANVDFEVIYMFLIMK
jgi:hypothetical protein